MKFRSLFILAILAVFLTACNFTLAADVTPPPGYVAPTPMPTLGPLYPSQPMNIYNGAKIYVEKCVDCHGATGLGDGEQGKQLSVKVAPIGLGDFASKAQPAAWYKLVTQGNMERYMPPFASLNDQDRWDVVGYAIFLHMDPQRMDRGKAILESNCADCAKYFSDLKTMSALSEDDLVAIVKNGKDKIPAFGKNLTDEELADVAVYLRSLTFEIGHGSPTSSQTTATPNAAAPSAGSTAATSSVADIGNVSGSVVNQTGAAFPADVKVILHGYEHSGDMSSGPKEVITLETPLNADGTYLFESVKGLANRIFLTEIVMGDMSYTSEYAVVEPGTTNVVIPTTTVYGITTDMASLSMDNVAIHLDFSTAGKINVVALYSMYNKGDKSILVKLENNGQDVPFIKAPANSESMGLQLTEASAPIVGTADQTGFYLSPTDQVYELMAFTTIARSDKTEFSQKFVLPVGKVSILVPDGVTISSASQLADDGLSPLQDASGALVNYRKYAITDVKAGDAVSLAISGTPVAIAGTPAPATSANPDAPLQNKNLLLGIGAFGIVLIALGAWLFIRDRNKAVAAEEGDEEKEEDEFEDTDAVMDAIIALDDLHRSGKLSDDAYQKRREELKSKLKKK